MKILLAGGGTGGHFFPLIAIAEELNKISEEEHFINFKLYYISDSPYNQQLLDEQFITYIPISAGKLRVYFSFQNFIDIFKTAFGIIGAFFKVFSLYPDVVISKGGYASFPTLCAARFLRIPVIIHESDTVPGRVNKWAGKFAYRIALSYPEAAEYFNKAKVSVTGQPVRRSIRAVATEGSKEFFELDPNIPTVGILGGSGGSRVINSLITQIIPALVDKYQIIHQTGTRYYDEVASDASVILGQNVRRTHYKPYPVLHDLQTKMFGGACDLIISRAGSTIFEIAAWGKPSIIIPATAAAVHGDHQRKNAYHYARTGAAAVVEEKNLSASILLNQIELILDHKDRYQAMSTHAKEFFKPEASRLIAAEAVKIALEHEK
jgi:UDP-N-acetylglucosamine--N-acetylmuramyl-(pentapeptide) pyrophosphoryl-undecaprenol N-acetylglucosamine transferase